MKQLRCLFIVHHVCLMINRKVFALHFNDPAAKYNSPNHCLIVQHNLNTLSIEIHTVSKEMHSTVSAQNFGEKVRSSVFTDQARRPSCPGPLVPTGQQRRRSHVALDGKTLVVKCTEGDNKAVSKLTNCEITLLIVTFLKC